MSRYMHEETRSQFDGWPAAEEWARSVWGQKVSDLNDTVRVLRKRLEQAEDNERKAKDFDKLIAAIKDDPIAKSYWDKIMVMLRLTER